MAEPPSTPSRRWSSLFIGGFLVVMIVAPATYYLRGDPFDERFAWRMFSSVRTLRCKIEINERTSKTRGAGTKVDPKRIVPGTWVKHLERAQPKVVAHYLESRCSPETRQVVMSRACLTTSGARGPSSRWSYDCDADLLERQGVGAP